MEWGGWQAPVYHWPRPETVSFLASHPGYELAVRLQKIYMRTMPQPLGEGLVRATESFNRWQAVVSILRHGLAPDIGLLSKETGIPEIEVRSILDTTGMPEIIAVAEIAGRTEFCRRACQNDPNPDECFIRCMQEG